MWKEYEVDINEIVEGRKGSSGDKTLHIIV